MRECGGGRRVKSFKMASVKTSVKVWTFFPSLLILLLCQIGIIAGTGLDDPDILANREEKVVKTPFGDVRY